MARKPQADELAIHYVIHHGQPREWKQKGRCSGLSRSNHPMAQAWFVIRKSEKYKIDGQVYRGETMMQFALQNCEMCPVQWECASFAVACEEKWSTCSMDRHDMTWLVRSGRADAIIAAARAENISMQRAVALAREHQDIVAGCPVSPPRSSRTKATSSTQ